VHKGKTVKNSCGMCCTKIENLSVRYGSTTVLDNVNLHLHCGELTALIGPNGAGKTTLFKAIIGSVSHSGKIRFTDFDNNRTSRPRIGYVPQTLETDKNSPISVLDLFASTASGFPAWLGVKKKVKKKALSLLSEVEAEKLLDRPLGVLSGGELQRVLLALALFRDPDILLLDEPVSGIDKNGLELFYRIIDKIRKTFDLTVIVISHDHKRIAAHADRFVLLDRKVLANASPASVLSSKEYIGIFGEAGV